jgi:hypothetical protein
MTIYSEAAAATLAARHIGVPKQLDLAERAEVFDYDRDRSGIPHRSPLWRSRLDNLDC